MTTIFDSVVSGYRHVEIRWGESLQQLAARELGDASLWIAIADLNDLVHPYTSELGGDKVAAYGQAIMVPSAQEQASASTDPDLVFERDVQLSAGRLVAVNGDLSLIAGIDNLKQALVSRITVDRGELLFHPEYGSEIRSLIGVASGPTAGLLSSRYAKAAVIADPRVASVNQSSAEVAGDKITVSLDAEPISGRTVQINVGV